MPTSSLYLLIIMGKVELLIVLNAHLFSVPSPEFLILWKVLLLVVLNANLIGIGKFV